MHRHWNRQTFRSSLKAQCTFKSLLIHGILLFSMFITLCCTLHHHPSQGIQCWKLCGLLLSEIASFEHQATAATRYTQRCSHEPSEAPGKDKAPLLMLWTADACMGCWHRRGPVEHTSAKVFTASVHTNVIEWCANDPSAGSPTETLLRLLLPLSDKVH